MKTLGKLVAIAMPFALSGCATQQSNEPRQPTRAEAQGRAKPQGGIRMIGYVSVRRFPDAAPVGVREYRVFFKTAADELHPTKFDVNGGTPLDVPSGIRTVASGLHTWNFDALSASDSNPPSKTLAIAGGELVIFKVRYE